jgi:hypothetical protein
MKLFRSPHFERRCKAPDGFLNYMGQSMVFTFRPGDRLYLVPYERKKVRRGDVVVFLLPGEDKRIVPRGVSVRPEGIRTKGDNNWHVDSFPLTPDRILGRVAYAQGKRFWRIVPGGAAGRLFALFVRTVHRAERKLVAWVYPLYRRMVEWGIFQRWLPRWFSVRVISLKREEGDELQLLLGPLVIGRLRPSALRWQIRPPFRLLVAEESLPSGEEERCRRQLENRPTGP